MNNIVVAKLHRLGKDGDNFSKKLIAETMRSNAKIDRDYVDQFNANWKTRGQIYEIDEEATKKRNESLSKKDDVIVDPAKEEREALKEKAKGLGIEFGGRTSNATLIELINAKENK